MSEATTEIHIEPLAVKHFSAILKIEKAVFKDPWSAASFLEVMSYSPYNWIATGDGHIVGYVVTQWVLDEIHVLNVAVASDMQRKGVASKLLSQVIEEGRRQRMRDLFLEVRVGNTGAIALYERFGFQKLSVRKKYYSDGEDALVMHCAMPEPAADAVESKTQEK